MSLVFLFFFCLVLGREFWRGILGKGRGLHDVKGTGDAIVVTMVDEFRGDEGTARDADGDGEDELADPESEEQTIVPGRCGRRV